MRRSLRPPDEMTSQERAVLQFRTVAIRRFTIVEVMIVVAIIAILAAIAIPALTEMQLRSKKAELPLVLGGIRDASAAYLAAGDACPDGSASNLLSAYTPRSASSAALDGKLQAWSSSAWGWSRFAYS